MSESPRPAFPPRATDPPSITAPPTTNGPPAEDPAFVQHEEFLAERALVQNFATKVIEAYGAETIVVVFLPWTQGDVPAGILCPPSNSALLNTAKLEEAAHGKSIVVCPCTFKYPAEESAATRIVEQLLGLNVELCVLAAHLLTADVQITREWSEYTNNILQRILATHVDDVLLDPDTEPRSLRLRIRMAKHTWETNRQNLHAIMQQEPQAPTVEEINALEASHQQLLWEDIPRELMPHFGVMDPHLIETDKNVGDYALVKKRVTNGGALWEAKDKHGVTVAIKCIDKKRICTPGEVEGINREYRFLQSFIRHPNIVLGLDFLHSQTYVYIILEYVGDQNLAEYLSNLPGKRLDVVMALGIFQQVVLALAHCHIKEITHRSVALEHVVLSKAETNETFIPKLVDFHTAMVAKPGVMSRSVCGKLPCIAPEMLSGEAYVPILADVWSIGILLLEMVAGLGSLVKAVDMTQEEVDNLHSTEETQQAAGGKIRNYFSSADSHERALAHEGETPHTETLNLLKSFLVDPTDRPSLQTLRLAPDGRLEEPQTDQVNAEEVVVVDDVDRLS